MPNDLRSAFSLTVAAASSVVRQAHPYESPVLDTYEAAAYVKRSADFVRRVLRYEIPVVQHGRRGPLGFFRADLDRWLARNTQEPAR